MPINIIVVLIYHPHKLLDLINYKCLRLQGTALYISEHDFDTSLLPYPVLANFPSSETYAE
jgi:hypothetical protein